MKTIREHLIKLCTHEHGYVFILNIINSTDDTKALKKSIFDPIYAEIETIVSNEWGRKVIDWFVAPADTTCFHPQIIAFIEEGLKYSKKDKDVRRSELLSQVNDPLCKAIAENPYFWLRGGHIAITTLNILKNSTGDVVKTALDAVASVICDVNWKVAPKEVEEEKKEVAEIKKLLEAKTDDSKDEKIVPELVLGVEHAGIHIALKKFFKINQFPASLAIKLNDETVSYFCFKQFFLSFLIIEFIRYNFSDIFSSEIVSQIEKWLPLNRATFLLIKAYENGDADVQQQIKTLMTKQKKLLKSQKHAASKILSELLAFK